MNPRRGKCLLRVELFCKARPLQRPRLSPHGTVYQPKDNQEELLLALAEYTPVVGGQPIATPIIIDMIFTFETRGIRYAKVPRAEYPTAAAYGDEDNLRKGVNDALVQTKIIHDDRLVVGGETFKVYGQENQVSIKIWSVK